MLVIILTIRGLGQPAFHRRVLSRVERWEERVAAFAMVAVCAVGRYGCAPAAAPMASLRAARIWANCSGRGARRGAL
jgi:hypothetical protein